MKKNIVVTGQPRSGKSTLLHSIVQDVQLRVGFVTSEIREAGQRVGFVIETHLGHRVTLAHVGIESPCRVSRYGVAVAALESVIPEVSVFGKQPLLYLDEIGQMQLFSERFRRLVTQFLDSTNTCLFTLSCVYQDDFISGLKDRDDIILVEITPESREDQRQLVTQLLRKIQKARLYVSEPHRFMRRGSQQVELRSEHGTRQLNFEDGRDGGTWACSCDFYKRRGICSHTIATLEFTRVAPSES